MDFSRSQDARTEAPKPENRDVEKRIRVHLERSIVACGTAQNSTSPHPNNLPTFCAKQTDAGKPGKVW
jgi:hypothetical protein